MVQIKWTEPVLMFPAYCCDYFAAFEKGAKQYILEQTVVQARRRHLWFIPPPHGCHHSTGHQPSKDQRYATPMKCATPYGKCPPLAARRSVWWWLAPTKYLGLRGQISRFCPELVRLIEYTNWHVKRLVEHWAFSMRLPRPADLWKRNCDLCAAKESVNLEMHTQVILCLQTFWFIFAVSVLCLPTEQIVFSGSHVLCPRKPMLPKMLIHIACMNEVTASAQNSLVWGSCFSRYMACQRVAQNLEKSGRNCPPSFPWKCHRL